MKKGFLAIFIGFVLFVSISGIATAGLMDTLGLGSKATSMGGAFAAYADDPFAVYYNPAGLTQIKRFTVSNGIHAAYPSIKVNNFHVEGGELRNGIGSFNIEETYPNKIDANINGFHDISNMEKIAPAPHFACSYPLSQQIVAGFGFYAPFGAEAYWNGNPEENPGAYNSTYGKFVRIAATPSMAYKVNERLSFGFGISLGFTEVISERIYYLPPVVQKQISDSLGVQSQLDRKIQAALDVNGQKLKANFLDPFNYSYNIGLMYRPSEKVTFGFTYRSRTEIELSGEVEFEGVKKDYGTIDGRPILTHVDGETKVDLPPQIQVGLRCQPSEDLSLEIDYVWTKWSIVQGYTVFLEPKLLDNRSSEYYRRDWEDTSQIRFGLEWVADDFITIRTGYFFDPSPVPDDTFDFSSSDVDKKVFSLGVGLNFGKLTVDTVFQYMTSDQERKSSVGGIENESLTKDYEFLWDDNLKVEVFDTLASYTASMQVWALGATLNYEF